ncbi:MAG: flagellar basal body L-ring protein FlgH [Limnochordia bacterium]
MSRSALCLTTIFLCLSLSLSAGASSLWSSSRAMYTDTKTRQVGDLITLVIVESSQATQRAETSTGQSSEVSVKPGGGILSTLLPFLKLGGGDQAKASGQTARGGTLMAQITTRVVEVLPGGNLRIEGQQLITINGEEQELMVSGIIRPEDITRENRVLSTYVADAKIHFTGAGSLGDKQKPGLLTRLFNWLF